MGLFVARSQAELDAHIRAYGRARPIGLDLRLSGSLVVDGDAMLSFMPESLRGTPVGFNVTVRSGRADLIQHLAFRGCRLPDIVAEGRSHVRVGVEQPASRLRRHFLPSAALSVSAHDQAELVLRLVGHVGAQVRLSGQARGVAELLDTEKVDVTLAGTSELLLTACGGTNTVLQATRGARLKASLYGRSSLTGEAENPARIAAELHDDARASVGHWQPSGNVRLLAQIEHEAASLADAPALAVARPAASADVVSAWNVFGS